MVRSQELGPVTRNNLKEYRICIQQGQAHKFGIWTLVYGLRLLKPFSDNILLENGGLPNAFPLVVHLECRAGRGEHSEALLLFDFLF